MQLKNNLNNNLSHKVSKGSGTQEVVTAETRLRGTKAKRLTYFISSSHSSTTKLSVLQREERRREEERRQQLEGR